MSSSSNQSSSSSSSSTSSHSPILIIGVRGVGLELAKNLILSSYTTIDICDGNSVALSDLGSCIFYTRSNVGDNRAKVAVQTLSAHFAPQNVTLRAVKQQALDFSPYTAVFVTDVGVGQLQLEAWNKTARQSNTAFIIATSSGLSGLIFNDFGEKHHVKDTTCEHQPLLVFNEIEIPAPNVVRLYSSDLYALALPEGATVCLTEIVVNEEMYPIHNFGSCLFPTKRVFDSLEGGRKRVARNRLDLQVDDSSIFKQFETLAALPKGTVGGFLRGQPEQEQLAFLPFKEALFKACNDTDMKTVLHPDLVRSVNEHANQNNILAAYARFSFLDENKLPKLCDDDDAQKVLDIAKKIYQSLPSKGDWQLDEDFILKSAKTARIEILPMVNLIGGLACQQYVQLISGKGRPFHQWFVIDNMALVPAKITPPLKPTPFEGQVTLFGEGFQAAIGKSRWCIFGDGLELEELVKMFAWMGVGNLVQNNHQGSNSNDYQGSNSNDSQGSNNSQRSNNQSNLYIAPQSHLWEETSTLMRPKGTDYPWIEEFLNKRVPSVRTTCFKPTLVEKANYLDPTFLEQLDGMVGALSFRSHAMNYLGSISELRHIPMLAMGTVPGKGNSDAIVPNVTASLLETIKRDEKHSTSEHRLCGWHYGVPIDGDDAIAWSQRYLKTLIDETNFLWKTLKNKTVEKFSRYNLQALKRAKKLYDIVQSRSVDACIRFAFDHLISNFHVKVDSFLKNFPKGGKQPLFWQPPKRYLCAFEWDAKNPHPDHVAYLRSLTLILLRFIGFSENESIAASPEDFKNKLIELKLCVDSIESTSNDDDDDEEKQKEQYNALFALLTQQTSIDLSTLKPICLNVHQSYNHQFDWVKTLIKQFMHIGRITEAFPSKKHIMSTFLPKLALYQESIGTVNVAAGFVGIEFIKMILGKKTSLFHSGCFNLNGSFLTIYECNPPSKAKKHFSDIELCDVEPVPAGFTEWDRVVMKDVDRSITVSEFAKAFSKFHHNLDVAHIARSTRSNCQSRDNEKDIFFMNFPVLPHLRERMELYKEKPLLELYNEACSKSTKQPKIFPDHVILLDVFCEKDGDPVDIPNPVIVQFQ